MYRPELIRSPRVQAAIALLQQLLANGVSLPSRVIARRADVAGIPEPALRVAKGHLEVIAVPQFGVGPSGRKVFAEWVWRLPTETPPLVTPQPAVAAAPLPPPPDSMNPAARAECIHLGGRWTHPLGDDEYRRLCAGGTPLPTPSCEPWLPGRKR